MKNVIRGALVAGLAGSAALGLAAGAGAETTGSHSQCPISSQFANLQAVTGLGAMPRWAGHKEDEDGGGDTSGGDSYDPPADNNDQEFAGADSPADDDAGSAETAPEQDYAPQPDNTESAPGAPEPHQDEPAAEPTDEAPSVPDAPALSEDPAPADAPAPGVADTAPQVGTGAQPADPVAADPAPALQSDVTSLRESVLSELTTTSTSTTSSTSVTTGGWNGQVTSWNSGWIGYDAYYRPTLLNPFNNPMQLVYTYDNAPRIITVPPLQSVAVDAPAPGVYGFTAVTKSPTGSVSNVSVGSFTGGGHAPAPGQPAAPKPVTATAFNHVLVQLTYGSGTSQPFRVDKLADLGDDAAMGARKVQIDGTAFAWGQWSKNADGERVFEISKTLQLPGLSTPSEAPLPGYPNAPLLAASAQSLTSHTGIGALPWVAAATGTLGVAAAGAALLVGRRRRQDAQ